MTGPAGCGNQRAADKRAAFRAGLASFRLQRFPGAFSPLVAKLVAEIGFDGVYTELPTLIDADTGFREPMNAARTVTMLEDACPTSTSRPVPLIT